MGDDKTAAVFALDAWKKAGREVAFSVQGSSMLPLIGPGDRVVLRLLDPHELRPGDLFAFLAGSKVLVHRFVKRRKNGERWCFCEAGDNLAGWQWLPGGKVLGKVVLIQGAGGAVKLDTRPWTWVNSFLGFVLAFSVSLCEDFQEAKLPVFLQHGAGALHRMNKKMLRTISKILLVRRGSIGVETVHSELPFVVQSKAGTGSICS
jgi:hypothetical protein